MKLTCCKSQVNRKVDGDSDFAVRLTPIEELEVGRRVRADAAKDEDDLSLGQSIDPATWKKLTFTAVSDKGTTADIVLLRPDEWVEQQHAEVGSTIYLVVPEVMNADALIHSIEPCPEIIDGPGQVVTGTFRHECADNVELTTDSESEPVRCTSGHPFWSEDRQDYLPAASFVAGEQLRTASGVARVLEVKDLPGTVPVFNLEVHVKHVYHVGHTGLLVHNTGCGDAAQRAKYDALQDMMGDDVVFDNGFHGLVDGHHGTPTQILDMAAETWGVTTKEIQGAARKPNIVDIPRDLHKLAHAGKLNGLPKYNDEFIRRLKVIELANGVVTADDVWNVRDQMLRLYFGRVG